MIGNWLRIFKKEISLLMKVIKDLCKHMHVALLSLRSETTVGRENISVIRIQLENVESFKYFGSILTNYGRCTCETKCRIAVAKAAFKTRRGLFLLAHWTWN